MKERCTCGHAEHEFGNIDEDDYHLHDGFAGVKAALLHHREKLVAAAKAGKPLDPRIEKPRTVDVQEPLDLSTVVKACAHCNSGGKLMLCTGCRAVYYCSKEHQSADWRNGHREVCKTGGPRSSSASREPGERPLGLEMLELSNLFKSVHKDMPEENKEGTLRKVIHVCEQIIKRGNPDNLPIPQVFYMLQEARQMIRPFVMEREGKYEHDESRPEPEPESKAKSKLESKPNFESTPRVETSDKQQSAKQTASRKKSGKKGKRRLT